MKLYAIRDKETGAILTSENGALLEHFDPQAWIKIALISCEYRGEIPRDNLEIVSFREEPAEPCEWCDGGEHFVADASNFVSVKYYAEDDMFWVVVEIPVREYKSFWVRFPRCPNCGRSLK